MEEGERVAASYIIERRRLERVNLLVQVVICTLSIKLKADQLKSAAWQLKSASASCDLHNQESAGLTSQC